MSFGIEDNEVKSNTGLKLSVGLVKDTLSDDSVAFNIKVTIGDCIFIDHSATDERNAQKKYDIYLTNLEMMKNLELE